MLQNPVKESMLPDAENSLKETPSQYMRQVFANSKKYLDKICSDKGLKDLQQIAQTYFAIIWKESKKGSKFKNVPALCSAILYCVSKASGYSLELKTFIPKYYPKKSFNNVLYAIQPHFGKLIYTRKNEAYVKRIQSRIDTIIEKLNSYRTTTLDPSIQEVSYSLVVEVSTKVNKKDDIIAAVCIGLSVLGLKKYKKVKMYSIAEASTISNSTLSNNIYLMASKWGIEARGMRELQEELGKKTYLSIE